MNRMYMKQNGGTLPLGGTPALSLNPSVLASFNRGNGSQPIPKRESGCSLKSDVPKTRGENSSHSEASRASAITVITPSHLHSKRGVLQIPLMAQNVAQNAKRGGQPLPHLPPTIPFGLCNAQSNASNASNGLSASSNKQSAQNSQHHRFLRC